MVELNAKQFWAKVNAILKVILSQKDLEGSVWEKAEAMVVCVGKQHKEGRQPISEILAQYLFDGYLLTNTIVIISTKKVTIMGGGKRYKALLPLAKAAPSDGPEAEIVDSGKDLNAELFDPLIESLKEGGEGSRVCTLLKETPQGEFAAAWDNKLKESGLALSEISFGLQSILMALDAPARKSIETACNILCQVMKRGFVKTMETELDEEEVSKTNSDIAKHLGKCLAQPKETKMKLKDIDDESIEVEVEPSVHSGGEYSLKLGASSNDKKLSSDVLICQMGVKYEELSAFVARTFLVDPTKEQSNNYKILEQAHSFLLKEIKPGAILGEVYDKVRDFLKEKKSDLVDHLPKSIGTGVGRSSDFSSFKIKSGSAAVVQENMIFYVSLGLDKLELSEGAKAKKASLTGGTYSLLIGDMVFSTASDPTMRFPTKTYFKPSFDNINYRMDDDDEDEDEDEGDANQDALLAQTLASSTRVTRSQTKTPEQLQAEREAGLLEQKILEAQQNLMREKARKALRQAGRKDGEADGDDEEEEKLADSLEVLNRYKKGSKEYPRDLIRNQIYCDKDRDTVLLPIGGCHVPFHISTIKTVSRTDEDHGCLLQVTFYYPTGSNSFARDVPPSMRAVMTKLPALNYIKELTFRSLDFRNLSHQFRLIKDMQKRVRSRQKQKEQEADLVEQVDLIPIRNVTIALSEVSMRPPPKKGKFKGILQVHKNGFRYRYSTTEFFDVIFANIKHFFFQECKQELTVIIHFHLKNPVMVGKTKTLDVQFYKEVVEASSAIDEKGRRGDLDEEREEIFQRALKKKTNASFKAFCAKAVQFARENDESIGVDNDYDMPYRKLAFQGVPHKEMVWLSPTIHCLVNLTESPFFVITLDEIEHIHFERVTSNTRNFDMVLILKSQMVRGSKVPDRITSIPMESLETIRRWLYDKGDITFTVGSTSLNWKGIMDIVHDAIESGEFWKEEFEHDGEIEKKDLGWMFLNVEGEESDDSDAGSRSSESAFDEEDEASSEASEESENSWMDEDEESSDDAVSEDDEGEDWDELDRQAEEADKKRSRREQESEADSRPKQKRSRR